MKFFLFLKTLMVPYCLIKVKPIDTDIQDIEPDYEIPKWVYKKVFKYNRHNRYFDDDIQ